MASIPEILENAAVYYGVDIKPQAIAIWLEAMMGVGESAFEQAMKKHVLAEKWFPRIPEILSLVKEIEAAEIAAPAPANGAGSFLGSWYVIRLIELENEFWQNGRLDLSAWNRLIANCYAADREAMGETVSRKLRLFTDLSNGAPPPMVFPALESLDARA
jgi:hypothetical protein